MKQLTKEQKETLETAFASYPETYEPTIKYSTIEGIQEQLNNPRMDDEFLLKKVVARFGPESCVYLPTREVLVTTNPQAKWGDLIQQRIRWAGKWKAHRSFSHALAAVLAFLVQLVWLESIYVFSKHSNTLIFLGMIWMIKFFSEKASLGRVGESLGHNPGILQFALTSLFHPIYVIWVGLGTIFIKVKWKGRSQEDSVF